MPRKYPHLTPHDKALGWHPGQRLRFVVPNSVSRANLSDHRVGCYLEYVGTTTITTSAVVLCRIELRILDWDSDGKPRVTNVSWTEKEASIALAALRTGLQDAFRPVRGRPYLPGHDPVRAMGANKRRKSFPTPAIEVPSVTPPTTPEAERMTTTQGDTAATNAATASAIAKTIADAVATAIPTHDDMRKAVENIVDTTVGPAVFKKLDDAIGDLARSTSDAIARAEATNAALAQAVFEAVERGGRPVARAITKAVTRDGHKPKKRGDNPIVDLLADYYEPGMEAPANVLLASPPSFGKSYAIRQLGEHYDVFLEHGCSDDMDEISTLLGSPMPDGKGGFIVVDGVLTEAVRAASAGKTVLLLLDEVLRLTPRAQEWLLTFLTGVKQGDGTRKYRLRTRRAMPSGELEVIECSTTHLHVIAATNLSIINPIEAFWSRWETVRVEFTVQQAEATAKAIIASYGVKDPGNKLAKAWAHIVRESRDRVSNGQIRFPVDFRMLERAVALTGGTAGAAARFASTRLADNVANWNPDTGDIAQDGAEAVVSWQKRLDTLANAEGVGADK